MGQFHAIHLQACHRLLHSNLHCSLVCAGCREKHTHPCANITHITKANGMSSWRKTDIKLHGNIKYKMGLKKHVLQSRLTICPVGKRNEDLEQWQSNNIKHKGCSLNFIILSALMMLLLNKNSLSSCKDIRQGLWLCIRDPGCHQQACSSGGGVPGDRANSACTGNMQREINKCNWPSCLRI